MACLPVKIYMPIRVVTLVSSCDKHTSNKHTVRVSSSPTLNRRSLSLSSRTHRKSVMASPSSSRHERRRSLAQCAPTRRRTRRRALVAGATRLAKANGVNVERKQIRVLVDLGFKQEDARSTRSLAKQLAQCVHLQRKYASRAVGPDEEGVGGAVPAVEYPAELSFVGMSEALRVECRKFGCDNWDTEIVRVRDEDLERSPSFSAPESPSSSPSVNDSEFIYLSPDADAVLDTSDTVTGNNVYIIGGIVDRNPTPKLSLHRSRRIGAHARRLPMERAPGGSLLAVNHVLELLLLFRMGHCPDTALRIILPGRAQV